jgi:hypothetical protein
VKWTGSRDKIFSPSGRGRTFFLTSLFIELIDAVSAREAQPTLGFRCLTDLGSLGSDAVGNCVVVIAGVITNCKPTAIRL